jgi:hypothetical protein
VIIVIKCAYYLTGIHVMGEAKIREALDAEEFSRQLKVFVEILFS